MTDEAARAQYQKLRLRMGVLGIGSVLVALWVCLGLGVPRSLDRLLAGWGPWAGFGVGGMLGLGAASLQLLPDVVARHADLKAGVAFDHEQKRFLRRYWLGVAGFVLQVFLAAGLAGLILAPRGTVDDPSIAYALLAVLLGAVCVLRLFRDATLSVETEPYGISPDWIGAVEQRLERAGEARPTLRWFDHGENSLAGGWEGFGARARLTLSRPVGELPPEVAAGLILRELGHRKKLHRWVSCSVSAAWLVAGVGIAWAVETRLLGPSGAAGRVFGLAAVMTTWSWVGLFVLPALGRRQVLAADRFMAQKLKNAEEVAVVFGCLAGGNLPDEDLSALKKYVFHPIPPLAVRRAAALEAIS